MKKLEGKVAVITGGNSGIGLATSQRFASEEGELDAAVKQIGKNNVTGVQGDVSNLADLDRLYATVTPTNLIIIYRFSSLLLHHGKRH